jgi:cytolysin (calcineurin-like family phosphatase)
VLAQNLHIHRSCPRLGGSVHGFDHGAHAHDLGVAFGQAHFAVKVPKICTLGHVAVAFAFEVFADFVLDGFEHAVGVLAFGLQGKILFHGSS